MYISFSLPWLALILSLVFIAGFFTGRRKAKK